MSDDKWTIEKVREEVYQARTRMFVVAKVLETGSVKIQESPEWVLVIKPLLKDLIEQVEKITALLDEPASPGNA